MYTHLQCKLKYAQNTDLFGGILDFAGDLFAGKADNSSKHHDDSDQDSDNEHGMYVCMHSCMYIHAFIHSHIHTMFIPLFGPCGDSWACIALESHIPQGLVPVAGVLSRIVHNFA
jgi:hypothetical protein